MNSKVKSVAYVMLCVCLWALIPLVAKLGQEGLDNHQFLFWSSLISFLTFLILITIRKKNQLFFKLSKKEWGNAVGLGFLGTYLYYILLYFGYANAKGIEVLVIQYCWPVLVIVLSVFILKERLNTRKIASIVLGFVGVGLVLTKGNRGNIHLDNLWVDGIVFLAAIVFALFSVLSKKIKIDALVLVTIYFLTATVFSFVSMCVLSDFNLPTAPTILPILINGVLVNGVSYIFWIEALKIGKASFVAPFVFLTPVISTVLLVLFFNEPFYVVYLMGMAAIIIGGLINRE
ncbi:DMT family transporter [Prolixibacteraceae bacterium JC049]|nr:DMT family transporter [Prolixibacteraceae bacterium JC049]